MNLQGTFKLVEVVAKWIANNHHTIQLMQMHDHILENSKRVAAYSQPEWHPTCQSH